MKRTPALLASLFIPLLAGAGVWGLMRSSFISFKAAPGKSAAEQADASLPAKITFNDDIQPILSENCYFCHGQDTTARKADLRLDRDEFAFLPRKNGQPVIVKGHPETSALIQRIASADPSQTMPPPSSHKQRLTPRQVALVTRWVKDGAQYQEHWAFVKPVRPPLPEVKNAAWVRNPIDSFVLAKLESRGLAPGQEAGRRSLIRRVTLDLTGLPPTPAEVSDFLADTATNAYENVVDRLLASPHYAEHEARYWLDAARYAETVGLHVDEPRSIWPYRDWVINAFKTDKPFNDFVVEQVAGDLLPNATMEQRVATGFTRCGISTSEGGSIEEEVLASYAKEHVETNATVFLGLTMGCCACHDHKFDPISQREFYQFTAYFRNTTQKALGARNEVSVPPYIRVPAPGDRPRWQALPVEREALRKQIEAYAAEFERNHKGGVAGMLGEIGRTLPQPGGVERSLDDGLELRLPLDDGGSSVIHSAPVATIDESQLAVGALTGIAEIFGDGWQEDAPERERGPVHQLSGTPRRDVQGLAGPALALDAKMTVEIGDFGKFDTRTPFSASCWMRTTGTSSGTLFGRMDEDHSRRGWDLALTGGQLDVHLINASQVNVLSVATARPLQAGRWQHVCVTYDGSGKPAGIRIYVDGQPQVVKTVSNTLAGSIASDTPFTIGSRAEGTVGAADGTALQDVRVYRRLLAGAEIDRLRGVETMRALLRSTPAWALTQAQREFALDYYLSDVDPPYIAMQRRERDLKAEYEAISARSPATMVMEEKTTTPFAFLLKRGQYDQKGDKLAPGTPRVLPPMHKGAPNNRLGLAQWLVSPEHPLLTRVTVNRFWQQFFGTGIVRTAEDFGVMGERPVNQPLLDWLAVEFREQGWSVRHMMRLIVTSAAYRQESRVTPDKLDKDPENRLVSRGPRFRLDAEAIRDQALAASGLLVDKVGGPPVKPYQPPGLWEAVSMTNETYKADTGEGLYRRSLYTYIKRLAPQPQLTTFDAPSRELCTVRRERTNTPLQALAMENDPQYIEAARHLAVNAIHAGSDPAARLDYMSQRLLARALEPPEQSLLLKNLDAFTRRFSASAGDAARLLHAGASPVDESIPASEQAAWTLIASEFLNLDETLNN